jgi:hypothetical protein
MKALFYIIVAIFLFFTAPIWVPVVGILGLATGIGAGTAIIAANHPSTAAPNPVTLPPSSPTFVATAPVVANPVVSPQAAQPIICAWVHDHQACRTVSEWAEKAREWCARAAQSTARRRDMQAKGWGTNRLFMTPYGAEFAREGQAEAMAGAICAAEQSGLALAQSAATKSMEH